MQYMNGAAGAATDNIIQTTGNLWYSDDSSRRGARGINTQKEINIIIIRRCTADTWH